MVTPLHLVNSVGLPVILLFILVAICVALSVIALIRLGFEVTGYRISKKILRSSLITIFATVVVVICALPFMISQVNSLNRQNENTLNAWVKTNYKVDLTRKQLDILLDDAGALSGFQHGHVGTTIKINHTVVRLQEIHGKWELVQPDTLYTTENS